MSNASQTKPMRGRERPIVQYNVPNENAVLRKVAEPVTRITRSITNLLDDMLVTMYAADGVGLAAPQIGVSKRVIVVDVGDGPIELINPEVVRSEGSEVAIEGCLSIEGLVGEVERPFRVTVTGLDRHGHKRWVEGEGLLARALLHEIDHLNGVLFIDRARRIIEIPPEKRLRIVFMGTPEFSVPVLTELVEQGFKVKAVVTQPDRPRGRGQRVSPSPVKVSAQELGLPVLQPERMDDAGFQAELEKLKPDVIITCAYGRILPGYILKLPSRACLNVHASLLPKYRGAAPIQHALLAGETETGITIFYMDEGMDTGDILLQQSIPIETGDTAGTLHDKLSKLAAGMLPEALRLLVSDNPPRIPQDHSQASYAPRIKTGDEKIDWSQPAQAIANQIRAYDPVPGAVTYWHGRPLKLFAPVEVAAVEDGVPPGGEPGAVIAATADGLLVQTGNGLLKVRQIQPAGGRRMDVADFLNGHSLKPGDVLA